METTTELKPKPIVFLKSKKILLVDDNDIFLNALRRSLEKTGCAIEIAPSAKVAQQLIGLDHFDAIISDIHMPEMSGIELTHYTKKHYPDIRVILTTGFAELKETGEAHALGADGFIPKPFQKDDLFAILKKCLNAEDLDGVSTQDTDEKFCKISIADFISGKQIKYHIFIRLSQHNYVKIAQEGEDLSSERIQAYKEKRITHLYLRKEDFLKYVGLNVSLAPVVNKSKAIPKEKKLAFLKHTNEVILEHIHSNGMDAQVYDSAKSVVENTISILSTSDEIFSLLTSLNSHSDLLYIHSLGVSMYATMIAKELPWSSPLTLVKVAMGGMLHDIGKKEIEREIVDKPRSRLSAEEVKIYESHPLRGLELLSRTPNVPEDVAQIAYQHHENCHGLGYPLGLTANRIHPMAKVVSVADEFCKIALRGPEYDGCSPAVALSRLTSLYGERLDFPALAALFRVFKVPAPPDPKLKKLKRAQG